MKRFFFDEEEDDEGDDEEMMEGADYAFPEFLAMAHQMGDPNQLLLDCSIRICERTFLWRFRSLDKKMLMIEEVFGKLKAMINLGGAEI
jgi:hypothetical protein